MAGIPVISNKRRCLADRPHRGLTGGEFAQYHYIRIYGLMSSSATTLLDSFSFLADHTRCRMLALLDQQELTVSELCAVTQLPQSTVSRHLKTLADEGWVVARAEGTSRRYTMHSAPTMYSRLGDVRNRSHSP